MNKKKQKIKNEEQNVVFRDRPGREVKKRKALPYMRRKGVLTDMCSTHENRW